MEARKTFYPDFAGEVIGDLDIWVCVKNIAILPSEVRVLHSESSA